MSVSVARLPASEQAWLHSVIAPYFIELAPDIGPPLPGEMERWWQDPGHSAWVIADNEEKVGFALILTHRDATRELAEFGIVPECRNRGLGAQAFACLLQTLPGRWWLGVASALPGTARFWDRVLSDHPQVQELQRGAALTPFQSHSYTFTARSRP